MTRPGDCGGPGPALRLAELAEFYDLPDALTVPSPKPGGEAARVVGAMLAGADSADDMDLLRFMIVAGWAPPGPWNAVAQMGYSRPMPTRKVSTLPGR